MRRIVLATLLALALPVTVHAEPMILRGVNLGDALETPHEGDWGVVLQPGYFPTIHQAGFDTIRVPIDWVDHAGPAPDYTIGPKFFDRIDWVIAHAHANLLNVVLDYQTDPDLIKDPDHHADRFVALWKQIAEHYKDQPESVLFELLNEPHDALTAEKWNALIPRALAVIRPANPIRMVVVGAVQWNSFDKLPLLQLPEADQHLLATFHYYLPMQFTHQGASWIPGSHAWLGTKWVGNDEEKGIIAHDFGAAFDWAKAHHRPLYLGEFGADKNGGMDSRARWIACCARTAESLGIGWTYWEFCAEDFGAYDPKAHQWRQPILKALVPAK
jgi:endoglucanase